MAWNNENERRLKELELISSGLGLTAPQVEEIEELIDLKEQSDAKPPTRRPFRWCKAKYKYDNDHIQQNASEYDFLYDVDSGIFFGFSRGGGIVPSVHMRRASELSGIRFIDWETL